MNLGARTLLEVPQVSLLERLADDIVVAVVSTSILAALGFGLRWAWNRPRLYVSGVGEGKSGPELNHRRYLLYVAMRPRLFASVLRGIVRDRRSLVIRTARLFDPEIQRYLEPPLPLGDQTGNPQEMRVGSSLSIELFTHVVGSGYYEVPHGRKYRPAHPPHTFEGRRREFGLEVYDENERRHFFPLAVLLTANGLVLEREDELKRSNLPKVRSEWARRLGRR